MNSQPIGAAALRRAALVCDLSRLAHNCRLLSARLRAEGAEMIAVVKANAYGHGAVAVAPCLHAEGVRRFAVATPEEAFALRAALPHAGVLVLGYTPPAAAPYAAEAAITLTVHEEGYAKALSHELGGKRLGIELKLNSGMNRAGFPLDGAHLSDTVEALRRVAALPGLCPQGVFSHLATADDPADPLTECQVARFRRAVGALARAGLSLPAHLSATAAVARLGALGFPLARVGLGLYGYLPAACPPLGLLPVARLLAPVVQILTPPAGERVGYGGGYTALEGARLGLLPLGYADGLPRSAEGGYIRVEGHLCPLVGRVSMDACTLLLPPACRTPHPMATVFGEEGEDLWRLAEAADTIPYELLARLGTRIDRKYTYANTDRTCDTE